MCPSLTPRLTMLADETMSGPIAPRNALGFSLMSFNDGLARRYFILGTASAAWFERHLFDARLNVSGGKPVGCPTWSSTGSLFGCSRFGGGGRPCTMPPVVRAATAAELEDCRGEIVGHFVQLGCPTLLPTPGGFERARQFGTDACESLINFEPAGSRLEASFAIAENKPLELLSGSNLLYLLQEHAAPEARIEPPDSWVDPVADVENAVD